MYSKEIPEITLKLYDLIEEVKKKIVKDDRLHVSKTKTSEAFGFYVDDKKNNGFLFFGIWYKQWIENGYPLCYSIRQQIQNDSEVRDIFLKHFPENETCSLSIISGVGEYEMDETAIGVISDKINTYVKECLELSRYSGSVD